MTIGEKIKAARKQKGWTQTKLADELGLSSEAISKWERDYYKPEPWNMDRLNELLKRDIDDWFDYYNNDRYQWQLAKLSPKQYYHFVTTGEYPLPGEPPKIEAPRGSAP